jgi:CII-binding regulator of phage lambda lysogenization HflD
MNQFAEVLDQKLDQKLDVLEKQLDQKLDQKLDVLKKQLDQKLDQKLDVLEKQLDDLSNKFDKQKDRIELINDRITMLDTIISFAPYTQHSLYRPMPIGPTGHAISETRSRWKRAWFHGL